MVPFVLRAFAPGAYGQVAHLAEEDQLLHRVRRAHGWSVHVSLPVQLLVRDVEVANELLDAPGRYLNHLATRRTREAMTTGPRQTLETVQAEAVVAGKESRGSVHLLAYPADQVPVARAASGLVVER